jgi:ATP-dependent DNA helicase RecG
VSHVTKGLLPYRGIDSGINRALEDWPHIDFIDDHAGCLFKVIVHRKMSDSRLWALLLPEKKILSPKMSPILSLDIHAAIIDLIHRDSAVTTDFIAT